MECIGSWMTYHGQFRGLRIKMRAIRWVTRGDPGLVLIFALEDQWAFYAHHIVMQYMT